MNKLSVLEFKALCNSNKLTHFVFSLPDQNSQNDNPVSCFMRFTKMNAFPCPDTIYFTSENNGAFLSFSNVSFVEFNPSETGIANTAVIVCKNNNDQEQRFTLLADRI